MGRGHTNTQTHRQTLRQQDQFGTVGQFGEKYPLLVNMRFNPPPLVNLVEIINIHIKDLFINI